MCLSIVDAVYGTDGTRTDSITHNVSKSKRGEHAGRSSGAYKINPQRTTRTINNQLSPKYDESFTFTETAATPSHASRRVDGALQ